MGAWKIPILVSVEAAFVSGEIFLFVEMLGYQGVH